jgi:Putative beta-barrel porin 2
MMTFKKFFIVIGLLLIAANAGATMEIHPYFTLEEEYNDNIDRSSSNEEEDWITTIQPGISLEYDNRSIEAVVDYSLRYRFYANNDEDNLDEFEDVQQANATVLFFGGRPFTLRVSEVISREALDERDDNEFSEADRSTLYHLTVLPEYNLRLTPTLSLVLGYGYDRLDYAETAGIDSEEHSGRVSLVKNLSASTDIYIRYAYTLHESDDEEDYDRQDYTLGVNYRIGTRTSATVEGGFSDVEYDSGFESDSTRWLVDLSYRLSEALTLSAGYNQDFELSAVDGLTKNKSATLTAAYQKESLKASLGVFWDNSKYVREDREDDSVGVRFSLAKPLARNLTANADIEYERAWFDELGVDEDVNRITVGTSFDYIYRRLTASLGYRYRINESDIDSNDYTNNIITLSGTMRF